MKKNHSFFTNNLCSTKWMRMLLMSFMLLLSSSLYATTFYIQGDSWLKLSNSNTKMTASSNIYSYTFTSENTGEGKWFKIFKDGSGDSNMLCYSGPDKNVPLNTTRSCTIGGSYTEFKMSVEKGVIYTITVTYTPNTNVKLKITAKEPIVITPNKEAPYYLKDEITLTATGGKGGNGAYQWYKKEPSESSYTQISGENNASYSFTLDGSYIYKVVDTTTGVESTIDIKPSVKCDKDNTKVIFSEDFGWFKVQTDRAKSEYAKYTEKLGCTNIKNGGEYAIVAVPAWGGCTTKSTNVDYVDPCSCPVNQEEQYEDVKMWFNKKLDHATEEKYIQSLKSGNDKITDSEINAKLVEFRKNFETGTGEFRKQHTAAPELEKNKEYYYGGMLLFNCKGGENDLLYEREINVCENTYINFSAWFSKANVSNKDKIGAKFVLLKGSTRTELDSYVIDNIDVNAGWKQISAMFNSKDCEGKVIVQLINYAPAGLEGNDLLVDDISLSLCTPEASLHADYAGNQTDNVRAMIGENVDLISGIDNVIFSGSPFYWWQKKEEGSANWTPLTTNPEQDRATYQVSVTNKKTEYRVIVANTSQAAKDAADNLNSDDLCGLYSVTNSVLVEPILLTLTPSRESESICSYDDNTLTLTVENTSSVAINDVYAQVIIPDGLKAYKYGTETAFDGKWEVGNLVANTGMATLKITLKPVNAVTTITSYVIKSYISAIGTNLSWTSYDNAVIKKEISFNVKPVPGKPTFFSEKKVYKECALTGSDTKVYFNTLIQGTGLKVYSNKELTNAVEYFAGATPTNKTYYANLTVDGCTGDTVQFPVTVLELPKLKLAKTDVTSICGTESDSKATLTYEIEGGTAPYTLSIQGIKEGGATETITPSELSTTGTYTLQPTTKTTYTFTKVADANGCYSESSTGLVNDITIEVVNLKIVKGLGDSTVCADKTLTYSIGVTGDDIKYQWYESTDNGATFNKVGDGSSTYPTDKFEMGDKKQYKVVVSQDPEVCVSKLTEVSKVTVNDCSSLKLSYSLKKSVCKDSVITLDLELTNNSDVDLEDIEVTIVGVLNQDLKDPVTGYNHTTGKWSVGSLENKEGTNKSTSITIKIKGTEVGTDFETYAYINKVGTTTYNPTDSKANKITKTYTVNSAPSITINADGNLPAEICAGEEYQLPTVTVTNNGSDVTSEGWYLGATKIYWGEDKYSYSGGTKITLDQGEYTFSINDNEKSLVYKAVNDCGETFKEFRPELDVNDCSNFIFEYFSDTTVCKDAEVVLTAKITNNSNYDLSNVILAQSWSGEQIASKDANNNNKVKDIFVTSGDVASEYDEVNNLWKIETFTAQKSAILTITFSAQKSEYFSMYMTESNGVEYNNTNTDNSDDSPVIIDGDDKVELKVLEISGPVTLKPGKNYNGVCPTEESKEVKLSDLVISDKTALTFFGEDKNKLTEEPTFDTKEFGSKTYYIINKESEKCESKDTTEVKIEIFEPVEASISATTTICSGTESDVKITVDGDNPDFTIVYNNGVEDITRTISGTTLNIADELSSTTTYKLVSVTDSKTCPAYLKGTEFVTVQVNPRPELASFEIEDTDDIICEGTSTNLNANFKGTPDFKFTLQTTKAVDGVTKTETTDYTINDSEWSMEISEAGQYKITKLLDKYCESATLTDAELTLTVEGLPELTLSATDVTLNCTTPTATITASGASTYEWSYLDQTGATQTKSGATLALQQTDPDVSSLVTEYTVYGYSKNANCKSEEAKTLKVTEDFVKPVVDIKISETADGTIPERLDCYQQNIKLEADLTNNKETIVEYIWSSGSDNNTTLINNPGTYTLQVKGENGCISDVATETIEQNIVKPEVSIESYITDPVTGNIIPTIELTCANNEITLEGTITNADQYAEDYPNGEFTYLWRDGSTTSSTVAKTPLATSPMEYTLIVTSPNGCLNEVDKAKVTVTENVSAPVLNIESVYKLCPSDTLSVKALSSLLPKTAGVTYKFYDEAGVEIDDFYGVSSENPVSTYYVVGTSENGCSSEKVSFDVDFAKNVDFTLTTSQTSMLVGGNETLVTIVPNEDSEVADTYTWLSNGKDILVEGLEYSANLYLDTKFEVTATNRCDTDTQEASVEVLWPTAFTPHNGNGKNDDFAKGMHIIVFNRFYTKIFEGNDGWDGTITGAMNDKTEIAVPGVYYYSVLLPNGEVKKGTIEIVKVD